MNKVFELTRKIFWKHKWVYRNPYDRTCSVCGRVEVSYCSDLESWNRDWWEAHNDGKESLHYE